MNQLGLMLIWSAIQVSLVLLAAAALHALASRRSPASGAWVASLGLGLAVVVGLLSLGLQGLVPGPTESRIVQRASLAPTGQVPSGGGGLGSAPVDTSAGDRPGLTLSKLREVWERLERTAAEPAACCRPWGKVLAVACLIGAAGGLFRLLAGLWAVHLVRRRSRTVEEPELGHMWADLLASMACRRRVEVRESPDLTAPATAGWRSHVILLPEDWRTWDDDERRAVLAHELAHIRRDDYLTGVMARAATALYFYHPLAHWLAARLRLEQELAADALGARFAGGRDRYLRSLSRLVLRQDGRLPCWPARAFLPAKGSLIRRIAMLREETKALDRPWSRVCRALAASLLVAASVGATLLHGPALADDPDGTTASGTKYVPGKLTGEGIVPESSKPFDLSYVTDDDSQVVVAFRPAAAFRRSGMGVYRTMLNVWIGQQWAKAATALKLDPTQTGQKPLTVDLFEEVSASMQIFGPKGGKQPDGFLFAASMFTIRTTEPIDWVALLRVFKMDVIEARDGDRVYYRCKGNTLLGPEVDFFYPDDRTVVFTGEMRPADSEKRLLKLLRRTTPPPAPSFAQGRDWDRSLRGLFLVALDNRGGRLAKSMKGDGPVDRGLSLFTSWLERTDLWALGLEDDDQIVFRGVGTCPDGGACDLTARAIADLLELARKELEMPDAEIKPGRAVEEKAVRMAQAFLKGIRVEREGHSVLVRSAGLGTLADFMSLLVAGGMF
jgi:beta-lactamase regulating signal transducer with metallopeptidase domain